MGWCLGWWILIVFPSLSTSFHVCANRIGRRDWHPERSSRQIQMITSQWEVERDKTLEQPTFSERGIKRREAINAVQHYEQQLFPPNSFMHSQDHGFRPLNIKQLRKLHRSLKSRLNNSEIDQVQIDQQAMTITFLQRDRIQDTESHNSFKDLSTSPRMMPMSNLDLKGISITEPIFHDFEEETPFLSSEQKIEENGSVYQAHSEYDERFLNKPNCQKSAKNYLKNIVNCFMRFMNDYTSSQIIVLISRASLNNARIPANSINLSPTKSALHLVDGSELFLKGLSKPQIEQLALTIHKIKKFFCQRHSFNRDFVQKYFKAEGFMRNCFLYWLRYLGEYCLNRISEISFEVTGSHVAALQMLHQFLIRGIYKNQMFKEVRYQEYYQEGRKPAELYGEIQKIKVDARAYRKEMPQEKGRARRVETTTGEPEEEMDFRALLGEQMQQDIDIHLFPSLNIHRL